jgi:hypothetical protein
MAEKKVYIVSAYGSKIPLVHHWGILVTDENDYHYIYHNSPNNKMNGYGGNIIKEKYSDFLAKGYQPFKLIETNLTEEEVEQKTIDYLPRKFNKIFFNCNDYVKNVYPDTPIGQEYSFYYGIVIFILLLVSILIIRKLIVKKIAE